MTSHSGERQYKYGICGEGYPSNKQLQDHTLTHNDVVNISLGVVFLQNIHIFTVENYHTSLKFVVKF